MRFENVNIALVPRKGLNCVDLAIMFYGRFLIPVLKLWALFAIPACTLVYLLSYYFLTDLRAVITVAYFFSSPLGVLLTWSTALFTFGNETGFRSLRSQFNPKLIPLILRCLFDRALFFIGPALILFSGNVLVLAGLIYLFFPGIWLAVRNGFRVEQSSLRFVGVASQEGSSHDHRTKDLISHDFGGLFARGFWTFFFCYVVTLVLFITFDYLSYKLLDFPILIGQIPFLFEMNNLDESLTNILLLMTTDPRVLTVLTGFILLVYPIGRLAWFFTYIDLRVRLDCWDMELRMTEVAQNLNSRGASS
ncbi:hypothetical protein Pan241w_54870 [Gimesia alba]|uniref:Uncharacterized protein n=1 Tax=Gimesia alba TaxID=2527973 RepID=A0A517RNB0_9PLAN|nr:hypothetical protein [Gimesia alba]QDT45367.1 hypothetical protein Pan241w_54870 [Gimesia alba]